jgi:hypothetical protein
MPAVSWDQPSSGLVSDPSPALELKNDQGGALVARSEDTAVVAESNSAQALRARTTTTLTGHVESEQFVALLARAPKSSAVIGGNESATIAVGGVNLPDPAIPNPTQNLNGIGVAGITTRFAATGVAGAALGPRSVGVLGLSPGNVGVRGVGSNGGVEGESDGADGVFGRTSSSKAAGVYGFGPGAQGAGVRAESLAGPGVEAASNAGPGVRATSQQAEGVLAEAKAANAAGVRAFNDHAAGVGVDGSSSKGIAVRALTTSGTAVFADAWSGRAVDASNFSQDEPAISAMAPASIAVEANSFTAPGVKAFGKTGVSGTTLSAPDPGDPAVGVGVFGGGISGHGVCGTSITGAGILGIGLPGFGWAGFFRGDVFVDGTLYKQAICFSIDHPLDPKAKVLNHAAVEAPEHKTFYDGVARLDARGVARVRLPKWFAALNDVAALRYQLTPLGGPAPDLHVARPFHNGEFVIAGGRPRQKVCWQVTGVRGDRYAKARPLIVEQSKRDLPPFPIHPTPSALERFGKGLRRSEEKLKRDATARERQIKSRRLPGALPAMPARRKPADDAAAMKLVKETVALTQRLSRRKRK